MKKLIISIVAILLTSFSVLAQGDESTLKFVGIPIDGTKDKMIKSLENEGFEYLSLLDYLRGMFNGEEVTLHISTNRNIVDRIIVEYPYCPTENDTRIKYNVLLSRFNRSEKYVCINPRAEVPANAEISRRIRENSKYYDAAYFFLNPTIDAKQWVTEYKEGYQKLYNKPLKDLSYEEMEEALFCMPGQISKAVNGVVWFTMVDAHHIQINYINFKNRPRGEDL